MFPQSSHIALKRRRYYYRRRIPGTPLEVTLSLQTNDYREAQHLARMLDRKFLRLQVSRLSMVDLQSILQSELRLAIEEDRQRHISTPPGRPVYAYDVEGWDTGKSPRERARVAWAHLRAREVEPREVLAVWLAVTMRIRDDPQPDSHKEYRHVQVAKVIHRMAGGTHKRWERHRGDGSFEVTQIHRHPISRGQVLRVIGEELSRVCEGLPIPEASFSPQMK